MQAIRQAASGLIYALVSMVLVVGSLTLIVAQGAPVPVRAGVPSTSTTTPLPSSTVPASATQPSATTAASTQVGAPTLLAPTFPTIRMPQVLPSRTHAANVSCGPFAGWLRTYVVEPGDNLFEIATQYRTSVAALQTANCKGGSLIYVGERLWVPNVPTLTPGITAFPALETPTEIPTEPLTLTPVYFTATSAPTETSTVHP
jgi:hypothetical protein